MSVEQDGLGSQEGAEGQEQGSEEQGEASAQQQEEGQEAQEEQGEGQREAQTKTYDEDYVKGLRKESASYRTKLSAANKQIETLQQGQEAGMQELSTENATLKEENHKLKGQIRRAAFIESIQLPNPRAAWALAQDIGLEVEWDENHRPQGLDEVRKKLREEDPNLFGEGSADGGSTTQNPNDYQGPPGKGRLRAAHATG